MMNRALIEDLAAQAKQQTYDPGATIIRQGARADSFFILVSGTVDVVKTIDGGASQVVSSMTAPAFFGEVGLMEDGRRTATIRAAAESPVEAAESPVEAAESPVEAAESPVEAAKTPVEAAKTPVEAAKTPVEVLLVSKEAFREFVDVSEMMADEIAALVQKYRIRDSVALALGGLSREEIEEIAAHGEIVAFKQGDEIICQGDPAAHFYVLTQGRVEVLHRRQDGRTYLINFHEPGEYFGEIGLLQNRPRSATVRAADERVELLAFDGNDFEKLMGESLQTEAAVAQEMARRLARQAASEEENQSS